MGVFQHFRPEHVGASGLSDAPLYICMDGVIHILVSKDPALDRIFLVRRLRIEPVFDGLRAHNL